MDITTWGKYTISNDYKSALVIKEKGKTSYDIKIFDDYLDVNYITSAGDLIVNFKDTIIDKGNLNYFIREIKEQKYIIDNNKIIYKQIIRKCDYIQKTAGSPLSSKKFLTMDLETMMSTNNYDNSNNPNEIKNKEYILIPYCVSFYDGVKNWSFYLLDYKNDSVKMLQEALKSLMFRKYNGYKIYLHNFSYFDGIFLMKEITSLFPMVVPVMRDHQLIDIKAYYGKPIKNKYPYKINFRDSCLLMPDKLSKLAKNFGVENKGLFPYKFVTENIPLDYKWILMMKNMKL